MIELIDVTLRRGTFELPKTSLTIPTGQCVLVTGSAGSGKTSIVEAICGLQTISSGQLKLRNQIANDTPVAERAIGYLPQDVVLFPHMTVKDNLEFGPFVNRWQNEKVQARILDLAKALALENLLQRMPHQLSGGQQKRVALARAVAASPDIICLDEPFVSLDEVSRELMIRLLEKILSQTSATILVVTHQPQWMEAISNLKFEI